MVNSERRRAGTEHKITHESSGRAAIEQHKRFDPREYKSIAPRATDTVQTKQDAHRPRSDRGIKTQQEEIEGFDTTYRSS